MVRVTNRDIDWTGIVSDSSAFDIPRIKLTPFIPGYYKLIAWCEVYHKGQYAQKIIENADLFKQFDDKPYRDGGNPFLEYVDNLLRTIEWGGRDFVEAVTYRDGFIGRNSNISLTRASHSDWRLDEPVDVTELGLFRALWEFSLPWDNLTAAEYAHGLSRVRTGMWLIARGRTDVGRKRLALEDDYLQQFRDVVEDDSAFSWWILSFLLNKVRTNHLPVEALNLGLSCASEFDFDVAAPYLMAGAGSVDAVRQLIKSAVDIELVHSMLK